MFKSLLLVMMLATPMLVTAQLRIVGGRKAANGSAPYQVSIRVSIGHFCGGSIVTPRVILTAAHCVLWYCNGKLTKVVVGTNQLSAGGQSYNIKKVVAHQGYNPRTIENDIAIIITDQDIQFSDVVQSVELNDEPVPAKEKLRVTGWGLTSYPLDDSRGAPDDLMELEVFPVSYEVCKHELRGIISVFKTQICAGTEEGQGACKGDSGGPLVQVNGGKLVGIVSQGVPCGTGRPDVYTAVHSYLPWIKEVMDDV